MMKKRSLEDLINIDTTTHVVTTFWLRCDTISSWKHISILQEKEKNIVIL